MKLLIYTFMTLFAISSAVSAGSNQGVVMMVHGNINGLETNGDIFGSIPVPSNCEDYSTEATPDAGGVEWFQILVVSPPQNTPNFSTIAFGIPSSYDDLAYIASFGPISPGGPLIPLPIYTSGWPNGPGSKGAAISWAPGCFTEPVQPVFYFGCYSYSYGYVALGAHPVQGGVVVDCTADPQMDEFVGYPIFGVGGYQGLNPPCPGDPPPTPGACCFGPTCVMILQTECVDQGGDWNGGDCGPNNEPCEQGTPILQTTWGSIKHIYQ